MTISPTQLTKMPTFSRPCAPQKSCYWNLFPCLKVSITLSPDPISRATPFTLTIAGSLDEELQMKCCVAFRNDSRVSTLVSLSASNATLLHVWILTLWT